MSDDDGRMRAALRDLTRRMVEGAPYEELTRALAALEAMPGADPVQLAGRRLALLSVYHASARERYRVLRAVMPRLAALPARERARWILGACVGHPGLAERYLPAVATELAAAGEQREAERVRDLLEHERDRARARLRRRSAQAEAEDAPGFVFPAHVKSGIEVVRWLIVGRRSYEEVVEALDAVLELPGGDVAAPRVATERLIALYLYERDDAEAERVLAQVAPVLAGFTVRDRAQAVSDVCIDRPALAAQYVPPVMAELEEELRQRPDEIGAQTLAAIRRSFERTMAGTQTTSGSMDPMAPPGGGDLTPR